MKQSLFFFIIWFGCCQLQAQPKAARVPLPIRSMDCDKAVLAGEANLRVSYALNADDLSDMGTYIDLQYLLVGEGVSKYYSALLSASDSLIHVWRKEHPNSPGVPLWLGEGGKRDDCWSEYQYTEIFKVGDEITVYSRMPHPLQRYDCWHKEPYPLQQWSIQNDTLTVCGYKCQKAVCHFRGRNFEAWFAPDIPVSQGPWKFGGLPGLILKLYDVDGLYRFECVNIEQGKFSIKKYDYSGYKQMDRSRLLKLQRRINEDFFRLTGAVDDQGKPLSFYTPYEPLELE